MPYYWCCVPGCKTNARNRHHSLHCFPNPNLEADKFRTWVQRVGGDILGLDDHFIWKNKKICNRHFSAKFCTRSRRITYNAIPTEYLTSTTISPTGTATSEPAATSLSDPVIKPDPVFTPGPSTKVYRPKTILSSNAATTSLSPVPRARKTAPVELSDIPLPEFCPHKKHIKQEPETFSTDQPEEEDEKSHIVRVDYELQAKEHIKQELETFSTDQPEEEEEKSHIVRVDYELQAKDLRATAWVTGTGRTFPETNTFTLDPAVLADMHDLSDKIQNVYPTLLGKSFTVACRGVDGTNSEYVFSSSSDTRRAGEMHDSLNCCECRAGITGYRYKCVSCPDYDLCGACEALGAHSQHMVMRISRPLKSRKARVFMRRVCEAMKSAGISTLNDMWDEPAESSPQASSITAQALPASADRTGHSKPDDPQASFQVLNHRLFVVKEEPMDEDEKKTPSTPNNSNTNTASLNCSKPDDPQASFQAFNHRLFVVKEEPMDEEETKTPSTPNNSNTNTASLNCSKPDDPQASFQAFNHRLFVVKKERMDEDETKIPSTPNSSNTTTAKFKENQSNVNVTKRRTKIIKVVKKGVTRKKETPDEGCKRDPLKNCYETFGETSKAQKLVSFAGTNILKQTQKGILSSRPNTFLVIQPQSVQRAAAVSQNSPVMDQNCPVMGQNTPVMGQNNPVMGKNSPVMDQNTPVMGQSETDRSLNGAPISPSGMSASQTESIMDQSDPHEIQNVTTME